MDPEFYEEPPAPLNPICEVPFFDCLKELEAKELILKKYNLK